MKIIKTIEAQVKAVQNLRKQRKESNTDEQIQTNIQPVETSLRESVKAATD